MQQKIIAFVCVFEFGLRFMKEKLKLCPLALYRHSVTKKNIENVRSSRLTDGGLEND